MNDIAIFEIDNQQVEVRLQGESVWLNQAQMAELFDTSTDNISLHLKNIFRDRELNESSTTEDFSVVRQEGSAPEPAPAGPAGGAPDQRQHAGGAGALLVAESLPDQKELMVKLVEHFLVLDESALKPC